MPNPTIVSASLDDKELKQSIANLVANVKRGLHTMLTDTNSTVDAMEKKLKSLGNLKIDSGGSSDGGASKRAKAQNAETDAVEKNVAARDKQIKKNQEVCMSYDQMAAATQKATSGSKMSVIETYDMQIELFKNRLREVRQDIDIFNAAIGSGKKTQIEWGQQGLKQANAEAEKLMRIITTLENQRGNLANVLAPQGHTIQNYVNSLQKANPELAQLNEQFKRGKALLQQQKTEFEQNAQAQRGSANATNQQKQALDEMNAYIRQNIQREQERRYAIRQTGLAARETTDQLIRSAHEQASAQGNSPITGIKELTVAVEQMRRAYFDMSASEKMSPVGMALEADIKRANEAIAVIKKYNQSLLGAEQNDSHKITNASTLESLRASLKVLTDQYNKLTVAELNAGKGDTIIQHFQDTTRAAQILQRTLNRPVSLKAALSGDERTLDDIAYKMQRLRAYKQGIDLTKPNAANEIKQVDEALTRLQKDADKWMSKSQEMIKSNTALGRSWNYMKNRLAFYFTVGAGTQFIKNLIEVRSQYEMNERALGILINSAERGTQIFNELSQMALVSPYTLIELSAAAKQLTAYDVAAKDVVDTTRRLADMASAVGIPIERLTYALGQIKAYGYLNSRDARMFANAGIPLVKQLADYYTELEGKLVSTADIYDRIKKKAIGYNDVMSVMYKMTDEGGKFFDFQAKMADTLKVRLANLTLAWNNMLNDIGKESQGVLTWGIGALRELFLQWRTFDKTLKEAAGAFGLYKAIQLIILGLQTATKSTLGLNARLTATGVLGTRLVTIFKALGSAMKSLAANWWLVLVAAAVELSSAIISANEATKEFNKSMREGAESTANDLKKYIEQYKDLRDSLYKKEILEHGNGKAGYRITPQDIDKNEASKAWETMREQIELSSAASTDFVSRLLQIENVSDRLREGFKIIDDIQQVNAALKDMGDEALVVTQKWSAWWNAWQAPDGLFTNLKEFKVELDEIRQKYGDIANARYIAEHGDINRATDEQDAIMRAASEAVNDYDREMNRFRVDLDKYTNSLDNFANAMEFSSNPTQVAELYAKAVKQLATQGQLSPQEAFDLQLQIEEARTNAMKLALQSRISDEESALKVAQDERVKESLTASIESNKAQLKLFENSTYEQTAYWNDFTKYIKERHISELSAAYNAMTDNGKKEMDFQSSEWQKYVHKWANSYEKSHNLATDSVFNRIKNWINDANTWSIFIKMTISTEDKKSVYKELGEWDKAADDAYKTMQRLDKEISRLRKKGAKEVGVMLENNASADDKRLTQAIEERTQAQKDYNEAVANGGESKKKDAAGSKAQKAAESELVKALKDELSTIDKVRSIYKDLTKEGMSHADAVERATRGWDETVNAINRVLQKNGLQKLDLSKFAGIENPRELVNMLQSQLNTLLKRGAKPAEIKELQTKIQTLSVDAEKYDLTKITKGLNNELGKLKDEYELAVELDADPELGNAFASMMGIDMESLPHTVKEYADKYAESLNKYLKGKNSAMQLTGDELRGMTRDDINALQSQVNAGTFNQEWFDAIKKAYDDIQGKRKKDIEDTEKWKNSLIEKYGNLQDKLTKIYKDSVQQQVNAVKSFGTEDQKSEIVRLQLRLEATDDPSELANINLQIAEIVKDVTDKNPIALKVVTSSKNQEEIDTSKAYWEDFKNSELYTMTFEDMANNSTRAIQLIIDKLNGLKDKVKEDPASMKALIKSLEDAENELNARDPFGGVVRSLRQMAIASQETKTAQEALWRAEVDVEQAQQEVDNAEDGTPEEQAAAQQKLADAVRRRADAQVKLTQAENKGKKGTENIRKSLQGMANQLQDVSGLLGSVSQIFKMAGDEDTSEAIDAINEGFTTMVTIIMAVDAAIKIMSTTNPYLLAIAAALSVIVGLVSFLSGNSNKKITEQVEESERAVKRLELAYIDLEHAVEKAYGMATIGANMAAKANKELQLVELKRQLALERSRDSKNRDEDKIIDLQKQIKELEYDIADTVDSIVDDLLGISSVGDAMENMMDAFIEALRSGEDAMATFDESVDEMIANMVKKMFTTKILQPWFEEQWNKIQDQITKRAGDLPNELAKVQSSVSNAKMADVNNNDSLVEALRALGMSNDQIDRLNWYNEFGQYDWGLGSNARLKAAYEKMLKEAEQKEIEIQKELTTATMPTTDDIRQYAELLRSGQPIMEENMQEVANFLRELGLMKDDASKNLSALQQGISQISESTAESLEAYMNGVSQQVYLHSDLLTQIRDAVVGIDIDIQVATQAQMLLQLQQSYAVQMAIQGILEGWNNPSGQAVRVELVS